MLHEDRRRARSFGEDPDQYDRARPTYPAAMVDDLLADGARRVLDVGCGTGIAGRLFAARGCEVVGVEHDARMAAVARGHGIAVDVSRFEDWTPPAEPFELFDLLICGQAWHWIDPDAGPRRAAEVLRPGGRLALFWNNYRHDDHVAAALRAAYERAAPELLEHSVPLGTMRTSGGEARDRTSLAPYGFERVEHRSYAWDQAHTTATWLDQLPTHSDHRRLGQERLDAVLEAVRAALDGAGGHLTVHHTTRLLTAVRV